jgi:putative hydrolase of the HAD superfamily
MHYKHLSFDLWGTLIKSNVLFSKNRAYYIKDRFALNDSIDIIMDKINIVGKESDQINMEQGCSIPASKMYEKVLRFFNILISDFEMNQMLTELDNLFLQYPPVLINEYIQEDLAECKNSFTMNISSNTAFIRGSVLTSFLMSVDLFQYFDFLVFSDEINASKPSDLFFSSVYKHIKYLNRNQILHLGDHIFADKKGATDFGFNSITVDFNNSRIKDLWLIKQ